MKCASCQAQIPASFGHAIKKNECPACGNALLDEESIAFIEELRNFILQTVKVREETANVLAMALVASYQFSLASKSEFSVRDSQRMPKTGVSVQRVDEDEAGDGGFVKASDLFDPNNPISSIERDEILKERIETRLITQNMIPTKVATRVVGSQCTMNDRQLLESPILEAERLMRLQKQQANEEAGLSKVRRS